GQHRVQLPALAAPDRATRRRHRNDRLNAFYCVIRSVREHLELLAQSRHDVTGNAHERGRTALQANTRFVHSPRHLRSKAVWLILIGAFALNAGVSPTFSQEPSGATAVSSATILDQPTLTGNWWGARDEMAKHGL